MSRSFLREAAGRDAPRSDAGLLFELEEIVLHRAELEKLIAGIEAMKPQSNIPLFDLTTEETVASLRDQVAELHQLINRKRAIQA